MAEPPGDVNGRPHHPPQPRETLDRCALRAQLRGDSMLGTAIPASRLLLVEQPGPWGRSGLAESRFDATVAASLVAAAGRAGLRVQAVRRYGRTPPRTVRRWSIVDAREGHESIRWGSYRDDAELLDIPLDGSVGEPGSGRPFFLVCAHSKHDTCCALRGRPVAAALDALRPGQVWETTHLGGDRFAANVLVVPSGLTYGRVLPFAAAEFVAAAEADEVLPALLRGRIGVPPVAQAALAFGYEQLALRRRADLGVISAPPPVGGVSVVRLRAPAGEVDVTVQVEQVAVTGLTCSRPRPGQFNAYRPTLLTPVV